MSLERDILNFIRGMIPLYGMASKIIDRVQGALDTLDWDFIRAEDAKLQGGKGYTRIDIPFIDHYMEWGDKPQWDKIAWDMFQALQHDVYDDNGEFKYRSCESAKEDSGQMHSVLRRMRSEGLSETGISEITSRIYDHQRYDRPPGSPF